MNPHAEVEDFQLLLFKKYLGMVKEDMPLAYLLKKKEFFGYDFYVDARVLVPRPETELLVEKVLNYLKRVSYNFSAERLRILDVGTGSGAIAISLAKELTKLAVDFEIVATDLSLEALEVARLNAKQLMVDDKIEFVNSNLLEVFDEREVFDVIATNLPYIGTQTSSFVEENVKKFEPDLALFAGNDGLLLYKKMFQELMEKDFEFNFLIGEFTYDQAKVLKEFVFKKFDQELVIEKDLASLERFFILEK